MKVLIILDKKQIQLLNFCATIIFRVASVRENDPISNDPISNDPIDYGITIPLVVWYEKFQL
jgi:hypothetical protein